MLQGLSLSVWILSSVIFGREVICLSIKSKANSQAGDSLERPDPIPREELCCHALAQKLSPLWEVLCVSGHLLAPSSGLLSSCSLTWLSSATGSSWLGHPEQSKGAPQTAARWCVWRGTVLLNVWAAPNGGFLLCACRLGCTEAAH